MRAVTLLLLFGVILLPSILGAVTNKDEVKPTYCRHYCGGYCCSPEEEAKLMKAEAKPKNSGAEKETNYQADEVKPTYCKSYCGKYCCSPEEEANLMKEEVQRSNFGGRKVTVGGSETKP